MTDDKHMRQAWYLALAMPVLFVASRFLGGLIFDNNWSFVFFKYSPSWYTLLWLVLTVGLALGLIRSGRAVAGFFSTPVRIVAASVVLMALFVLFRYDSFVLGGGNLRIGQIAQAPVIVYRWFEFGAVMLVSWGYAVFSQFDLSHNMAAVFSWELFAFLATAATLIACLKLAAELAQDAARRVFVFLVMFVGPQTMLYFGFIGVEPVIPAVTCWVAWAAVRLNRTRQGRYLLVVWGLTLLGLFLNAWSAYLLPAVLFVTVRFVVGKRDRFSTVVLLFGGIACVALFVAIYFRGMTDFEFSHKILFWRGKPPFGDYGLFSLRHIGDIVQLFLLVAPVVIVTKYLWMRRWSRLRNDADMATFSLMALAGGGVLVVMNPVDGIVFDLPRLVAYLTPMSLLLGLLLADLPSGHPSARRLLALAATLVLIAPLGYLPVLLHIRRTEPYAVAYFDQHKQYYLQAGLAFRDAYYYLRNYDERKKVVRVPGFEHVNVNQPGASGTTPDSVAAAPLRVQDTLGLDTTNLELSNKWDWAMPTLSSDYLNLSGANDLITAGRLDDALTVLYRLKAQRPYWAEARATLVSVLIQLRRYRQARVEIDTCLMLQPYSRVQLMNNYICYRDTKDFYDALAAVQRAAEYFPDDKEILTDLMIIQYRAGNSYEADTMAVSLMAADSTLPYPYLVKGFLEDSQENYAAARRMYERFIALAPDEPETERVKKRLEALKTLLHED